MSAETGGKPPSGSSPGRPAADTPQRLVVRGENDSVHGASDTAVAMANSETMDPRLTPTELGGDASGPKSGPLGTGTSELIGTLLLDRFLVTKQIGQGGMGAVYEATHTLINKRVAVKVLLEKYAQREQIVTRLKKEATLASSIRNEHIIDITDIGNTADGRTFVVMEYLEGESLAECLAREHELPEQRTLRIASQAASALAAAHAKGIVHRDIKPENLFLLQRNNADFVKVVDFGISKSLRASTEEEAAQRLTQTGMVLGTPLYMSPEQARGDEDLDHRVDIYAL
ncbi:MAG: serine/threonine-protein kinase, partial [Deltaproteobacteria bacterium]